MTLIVFSFILGNVSTVFADVQDYQCGIFPTKEQGIDLATADIQYINNYYTRQLKYYTSDNLAESVGDLSSVLLTEFTSLNVAIDALQNCGVPQNTLNDLMGTINPNLVKSLQMVGYHNIRDIRMYSCDNHHQYDRTSPYYCPPVPGLTTPVPEFGNIAGIIIAISIIGVIAVSRFKFQTQHNA